MTDNGNALSGVSVKFTKGTTSQTLTTNANGYAYVDVDWACGTYDVKCEYGGKSVSSTITVKSTISVSDLTYDYGSPSLRATFYNTLGNVLSNSAVKYKIGSAVYSTTTNSNGNSIYYLQLNAGTYDVTAINPNSNEEKSFKLTVRKVTPTISLSTTQNGELVTLTATLSKTDATGNVVFTVGSNRMNFTRTLTGGKATLTLNLTSGSYQAYATYAGNANFNSAKTSSMTFTVKPLHSYALSAYSVTMYYGSSTRYSVKLTDNGKPLSGAGVKISLNGKTQTVMTDTSGYAYLSITLSPGTYDATSTYGGASVKSWITVKSTISSSDLTYDYGNSYLKATFYGASGIALSNTHVKFKIGTATFDATTNSNGLAVANIKYDAGTYDVSAINTVNGETKSFKLTISKATPILTLKQITLGGDDVVRASLSQTSATGIMTFTVGSNVYTASVSEGISNLKMGDYNGDFNVDVKYSGDNNFNPVSKSISVSVGSYPSTISVKSITKVYGDSKKLTITVKDNRGNVAKSELVSIDVYDGDWEYYDSYFLWTNSKGQVQLSCNFLPDSYILDIEAGDILVSSKVTVKKVASKLFASNRFVSVKSKIKAYSVVLKNNKNKVLKNQKVTLRVGGINYVAKTNSYGKATFKITKLTRKGSYNAKVSYAGSSYYKKVSKAVKIYVR